MLRGLIALAIGLIGLLVVWTYAYFEPQTSLGLTTLRFRYRFAVNHAALLAALSDQFEARNGGTIPWEFDADLRARYRASQEESERDALVDFYVGQQHRQRPGDRLEELVDLDFVDRVFSRIDGYDHNHQIAALLVIEACGRGHTIHKTGFSTLVNDLRTGKVQIEDLKRAYQSWWNSSATLAVKKSTNPLDGFSFQWTDGLP